MAMRLSYREEKLEQKGYHYIGFWTRQCPKKGCKKRFRVEDKTGENWAAVCETLCPFCGWKATRNSFCLAERIWGRFSEKHSCGSKCMNAKGPHCDCACGGENHGAGHSGGPSGVTVEVPGGVSSQPEAQKINLTLS